MSSSQEPPNGDFVAYLEVLERQSAARILARSQVPMAELPHAQGRAAAGRFSEAATEKTAPVLDRQQAKELLARLTKTGRASSQATPAAIAFVVGLVLLLFWFIADGGVVPFLIGIGLIAWSVSRLRGLGRGANRDGHEREQIAQSFGNKPPKA
jgi:hypothetical protein